MNKHIILLLGAAILFLAGCSNSNFTDYEDANPDNSAATYSPDSGGQ